MQPNIQDSYQDSYQNAERLRRGRSFDKAAEKYREVFEACGEGKDYALAIDCIIKRTLCEIEDCLQDLIIITPKESNALRNSLKSMKTDIKNISLIRLKNRRILYNSLHRAYLQIEKLYDKYGFIDEASEYFCRFMDYRRRLAWPKPKWLFLWILKLTCRYGERGWRLLVYALSLIFLFAGLYCKFELIEFSNKNVSSPDFWDSFYFSIVAFTTLGFGDIKPACLQGRLVVSLEVILGYAILGLFIGVIASKILSRMRKNFLAKNNKSLKIKLFHSIRIIICENPKNI